MVVSLILLGVGILIGVFLTSQIVSSLPTPTDAGWQSPWNQTQTNLQSAFNIASIVPLVFIAGVIITYLVYAFAVRMRR